MKRIAAIAFAAVLFGACAETQNDAERDSIDDNTAPEATTTIPTTTYTPTDGDVLYEDSKVKVNRNGEWVEADKDVELENGVVVYRNGKVKKADKEIELEDGEMVDKTGNFFDRTGQAIEKGWDDTKAGVKKAGEDIEKAGKRAGDDVENAVDGDKDNK